LAEKIQEILGFKSPIVVEIPEADKAAYLLHQLSRLEVSAETNRKLEARSRFLRKDEQRLRKSREANVLREVGWT
jgi:hypothetical protein